jgi:hypothetical protein
MVQMRFCRSNGMGDTQTGEINGTFSKPSWALPSGRAGGNSRRQVDRTGGLPAIQRQYLRAFGDPSRALYSYSYQFSTPAKHADGRFGHLRAELRVFDAGFTRRNQSTDVPTVSGFLTALPLRPATRPNHFHHDRGPGVPDSAETICLKATTAGGPRWTWLPPRDH